MIYRNVGYKEIMSDYKPKWLAIVGLLASFGASLAMPIFGYVLSQFIFVLTRTDEHYKG